VTRTRARGAARSPSPEPGTGAETILADRLHSAAIHLLRRLRRVDAEQGLSAPRLSALSVVVFGGPLTLGELAHAEQVRPPTMTRLAQALEREGLVDRRADPTDGRIVRIRATAKGRSLLARGRARRVETLAAYLGGVSAEDRAAVQRAIEVIERIVGRGPFAWPP
jgi:DNA-binding MarR family transcriptional regulator